MKPSLLFGNSPLLVLSLCLLALPVIWLSPHFQTPDEPSHFLIGCFFKPGQFSSAGHENEKGILYMDDGLLNVILPYDRIIKEPGQKYTADILNSAREARFTGNNVPADLHNIMYYFPLPYLPQKVAVECGKFLGLQPYGVYHLVVLVDISCAAGILWLAISIGAWNPLMLMLLCLPMAVFQCASASVDGINFALAFLCASLYAKCTKENKLGNREQAILFVSLAILILHRIYLAPLALAPALLYFFYQRDKKLLYSSIALCLLYYSWLFYVMLNLPHQTHAMFGEAKVACATMFDILSYYLTHPLETAKIFINTFEMGRILLWCKQFIGILGWLSVPLPSWAYATFGVLYAGAFVCTLNFSLNAAKFAAGLILVVAPVFLIFFMELVAWTPFPGATVIGGVQGRYFIPPAIFAAAFFCGGNRFSYSILGRRLIESIYCMANIVTSYSLTYSLINRYYI